MAKCIECGTSLGGDVIICPICGANQSGKGDVGLDNIERTLSSTPTFLIKNNSEQEAEQRRVEVERLMKRGDECFNSAKAWLGSKDKSRARKEYQRAFKYYDTVLKLDPNNDRVREARAKCLFKMA